MRVFLRVSIIVLALATLVSCSRKKNSFINRNFHAVTTKFNTIYNGEVAFETGRSELDASYQDNYWEILPVERIETFDDIIRPGASRNANFERAEEKASKAIQKHSMQIDGKEYNPQIDESFVMLGKARYFEQRFIPALEAFNYVLAYYPTSNSIAQAKIWKEKTNIRLENNELAIKNLRELLEIEDLSDQDLADASAMLSQAFLNLEIKDTALAYIKDAALNTRKNEERGRYNFIKGQLYNKLEYADSANWAFDEVIALNRKIPRKYLINAHLEKIRNFDYETGDVVALLEFFEDLEKNRENRSFLDKIFYRKAEYYQNVGNEDSAIFLFNKSLRTNSPDNYLVSRNYLALAEYNFEDAEYKIAGSYYDSTLGKLDQKTREFRRIKKKRDNLVDVIEYETIAGRNDSIIKLTKLSEEDLKGYFENYIAEQKEKARKDSIAQVEEIRNNEFFNNRNGNSKVGGLSESQTIAARNGNSLSAASIGGGRGVNQVGQFYFYNTAAAALGKQDFERRWGRRALEDNWRLSSKQGGFSKDGVTTPLASRRGEQESAFSLEDLIASVPKDEAVVDSIIKERDLAYYQLGLIYKEKFKEYPLTADRLETLLTFNPEERLILPSKYNLYQAYNAMSASAKANDFKNDIISNYPDSRYASILKNPSVKLEQDASSPEAIYSGLYRMLENQEYVPLLNDLEKYIDQFFGDEYLPKFELLKATALGRFEGFDAYEKAVNFVALTYPRSEEGKRAQQLLSKTIPALRFKQFANEDDSENWKVLYPFLASEREAAQTFKERLNEIIVEEEGYIQFSTSVDVYDENQIFVVIHGLDRRFKADGLASLLRVKEEYSITRPSQTIAAENYKFIQVHKNYQEYLTRDRNLDKKEESSEAKEGVQKTVENESKEAIRNRIEKLKQEAEKKNKVKEKN